MLAGEVIFSVGGCLHKLAHALVAFVKKAYVTKKKVKCYVIVEYWGFVNNRKLLKHQMVKEQRTANYGTYREYNIPEV